MECDELERILADLRAKPTERTRVEAKASRLDLPHDAWQTISAFANGSGGLLLLGIRDGTFDPIGVDDVDRVQTHLTAVCANEFNAPLRAVVMVCQLQGRIVIVAEIPAVGREDRPLYKRAKGLPAGAFVRTGNTNRQMTMPEVRRMLLHQRDDLDARAVHESTIDDLDPERIERFEARIREGQSHPTARQIRDEFLVGIGAVVREGGTLLPSLAGLLFFGRNPQRFFPNLKVTFTQYAGTDVGESAAGKVLFLDNRELSGPVPDIIESSVTIIMERMTRRGVQEGLLRRDVPEYPMEALREAVVNAVAHRDYGLTGTEVQIRLFADRLEIQSPGESLVPIEQLATGRSTRNPVLMRLLRDAGYVEERGIGIDRMLEVMARADMEPPVFEHVGENFRVTMKNHSLLSTESLEWLRRFAGYELNDRQRKALVVMRYGQEMTNVTYRALNFVDRDTATHDMQTLREMGLVEQIGARRAAKYVLPEELLLGAEDDSRVAHVVQTHGSELGRLYSELIFRGRARPVDLVEALRISRPTVVKRLKTLTDAGLVERIAASLHDPTSFYRPLPPPSARRAAT